MELWNLVFMQFNQSADGERTALPKPSIDTGAGLERILTLKQGVDSVWETDLMQPMIDEAQSITGHKYIVGDYDDRASFATAGARRACPLQHDAGQRRRVPFERGDAATYFAESSVGRCVSPTCLAPRQAGDATPHRDVDGNVMGQAYPDRHKNMGFITDVIRQGGKLPSHA